ncbi:MAG TPA: ABC transporter permease [Gemmatimonadaceae bacterium]|nr:ABC transporter permease [Gemmatimonadaceae bacterium]
MGKFIAVFKREYLERVRTRAFILTTLLAPLLFGAVMTLPAYLSMKSLKNTKLGRTEILDATGTGFGTDVQLRLTGPMADTGTITVKAVPPSELAAAESTATHAVQSKAIAGYIVVDSSTLNDQGARYAGREASSVGEMQMFENAIKQALVTRRLEHEGLDPKRVDALTKVRLSMSAERISEKGRGGTGLASTILGGALAFLLYMSLVLYGQNTLRSVIEEKTTRVSEVIVASVNTDTLLAGKVLGVSAVGITQQIVWALGALLIYNGRAAIFAKLGLGTLPPVSLPHVSIGMAIALALFFLLGFLFYSSLFAAAGATVSSDQEAQQAAQPIILLLVASIIFIQPILLAPSSTMARVLSWLPFSAPIVMPLRMSVVALSPIEISLVIAGLAVACALAILLASRIYRVGMLMYGKRPSFAELGRWIAQS